MNDDTPVVNNPIPVNPIPSSPPPVTVNQHAAAQPTSQPNQGINPHGEYHSNPFSMILHGLSYVFDKNGTTSLLISFVSMVGWSIAFGVGFFVSILLALLGPFGFILIIGVFLAYFYVAAGFTGAMLSVVTTSFESESKSSSEFLSIGFKKALPLVGLNLILSLMITIGFILLVIPGLLFLGWYSLAPYAMISENLGVFDSLKRSKELSKGHLWEIYGAIMSGFFLSGWGLLGGVIYATGLGTRYEELKELKSSGKPKPDTHWLNWVLPIALFFFAIMYFGLIALSVIFGNTTNNTNNGSSSSTQQNLFNNNSNQRQQPPVYKF